MTVTFPAGIRELKVSEGPHVAEAQLLFLHHLGSGGHGGGWTLRGVERPRPLRWRPPAGRFANACVLSYYDELNPHDPPRSYEDRISDAGIGPLNVLASEYTFMEKANVARALADMFAVMYPQLQGIDFRRDVPRLQVPVYLLDARHKAATRRLPAHEWFNLLKALFKKQYVFGVSGHSAQYEQADRLHHILIHTVLRQTYDPR
jgi:pimeloyl-ACP methyl ester carboxylesterase